MFLCGSELGFEVQGLDSNTLGSAHLGLEILELGFKDLGLAFDILELGFTENTCSLGFLLDVTSF